MSWLSTLGQKLLAVLEPADQRPPPAGVSKVRQYPMLAPRAAYGQGGNYSELDRYLNTDGTFLDRLVDYAEMDKYPELAAALNLYADDATQPDTQTGRTAWAVSSDDRTKRLVDDLLHRVLRVDDEAWSIARTVAQFGQDWEELYVTAKGVEGWQYLPVPTMRRVETPSGSLLGYAQDMTARMVVESDEWRDALAYREALLDGRKVDRRGEPAIVAFRPWEVVHFRHKGGLRHAGYGVSVLEPARWIWRRLALLEDTAMVFRLQRSQERLAFYVNTGSRPAGEAGAMLRALKASYKKKSFINPRTGQLQLKLDPLSPDDDIWLSTSGEGEGTRVELLQGPQWQSMDDIEYFFDKLVSAITVPKAYLGKEEGVVRATLSSQDIRFARGALRVQRAVTQGLDYAAWVHCRALGVPVTNEVRVQMTVPNAIMELAQLEVRSARADLAGRLRDVVSLEYLLREVLKMTDLEVKSVIAQRKSEAQAQAELDADAQALLTPEEAAGRRDTTVSDSTKLLKEVVSALRRNPTTSQEIDALAKKTDRVETKLDNLSRLLERHVVNLRSGKA